METPFFFRNDSYELFGVLHEPAAGGSRTPFVFCHPFAEEKLWTHRTFVSFARILAQRGHAVLRFDYMGNGDSGGSFHESSLETNLSDLACAIDHVKAHTGSSNVNLLGLRFGAALAALAAEQRRDVAQLVAWAPVVDCGKYMQEMLRINLTTQLAVYREVRHDREALVGLLQQGQIVNIDGYGINLAMFEQLSACRLSGEPKQFGGPCLIVHVGRESARPATPDVRGLSGEYANATLLVAQEEPFWKEIKQFYDQAPNLFAATVDWLDRQAAS